MTSDRSNQPSQTDAALQVPMSRVVGFVRQLSHDLRNHLNAVELQAAYMNEIITDAELKGEVQRLRGMFSDMGRSLQTLSNALGETSLTLIAYEAASFFEDLQLKIKSQFPEEAVAVQWQVETGDAKLNIDPQILQPAFLELFANAFRHGHGSDPMEAKVERKNGHIVFQLREPKTKFEGSTAQWGREPFAKVAHGHYGLGLHRTRSMIEAHGGRYDASYDAASASLTTTVVLPIISA